MSSFLLTVVVVAAAGGPAAALANQAAAASALDGGNASGAGTAQGGGGAQAPLPAGDGGAADAGLAPEVIVPPVAQCDGGPTYPDSEKNSDVQGSVLLRVTILQTGAVSSLEVARSLSPPFDEAALESTRRCTFSPATRNGQPVAALVELSVEFVPPVQPWTLEGEVVGELGEALPNATVSFGEQSTVTDLRGHFSLTFERPVPGESWVLVSHPGHAERGYPEPYRAGLSTHARYVLKKEKVYVTRIEGSRLLPPAPEADHTPQVSRFNITRSDLDRTPGAMEDVARVAQQAPGVAADPDLLGALYVRGGGPDETIFYLDGVPLSNPYHLGGYASIFNPMMLESAEFYTGAAPGRYEPSLSGALEVHYATGDAKKLRLLADISMQSAMLRADIPLVIEGLSMIVSARRTYFEAYFAVLRALKVVGSSFVAPEITELLVRVNYKRGRHLTTATYMYASDGLDFIIEPGEEVLFNFAGGVNISNQLHLALLQHRIDFAGDSRLTFSAAYTHDANDVAVNGDRRFANDALRDEFLARADAVVAHSERHNTRFGAQYAHRALSVIGEVSDTRSVAPWRADPFVETYAPYLQINPTVMRDLLAVYAEHTWRPVQPLTLEGSGRGQLDARSSQWSGSARLAAAWTLPFTTVLKLSGGFAAQPTQVPLLLDPTFGNPKLKAEQAWTAVLGIEQPLPIEALVRLELWGKWLDKLIVNPDTQAGVDAQLAAGQSVYQNLGTGFARGADLLFTGRARHFFYGLSMGLLFSDRTNPLAQGVRTYATPWDQRFTANASLTWSPTEKWVFTGRLGFRTGRPYTPVAEFTPTPTSATFTCGVPSDQVPPAGCYVPRFGDTNSSRYPGFYELSVRGEYHFKLGPVQMAFYAEVLNLTYSNNVFAYTYDQGDYAAMTPPAQGELNHLPIRPFLGIRGEL